MNLTDHQLQIMNVLRRGNLDGSSVDLDQLLERLAKEEGWETNKASIQFSIRAMIRKELIAKAEREVRRGRKRAVLTLTELGRKISYASADSA